MNPDATSAKPFSLRLTLNQPGGGAWLVRTRDAACDTLKGADGEADVALAMSADICARMWNEMNHYC